MNLKSGLPYSLINYGLVANYPKLSKNIRADVLVIGGGISGALLAWHLAKENIDTVVIDGRTVGLGSTCASSSLLLYEIDTPLYKLQQMIGTRRARLAYNISQQAVTKLKELAREIGFKNFQDKESVYYAANTRDVSLLKKEFLARKKAGIAVEYLEGALLKKETGIDAPAAIISSLAAQTDAYLLTHTLLAKSKEKGVAIYDRSRAVAIDHKKDGAVVNLENGSKIEAKKLVFATGYESVNYIDKPLVKLRSTFATVSESASPGQNTWKKQRLIWNTADPYLYLRTTPDNRIMIGGRDENFYDPARRNKLLARKTRELSNDFYQLFPALEFVPEFSWTGTFGYTKDGLPYIGTYKKIPGSYFALGFGGNGITFSLIAAEIITAMLLGKKLKETAIYSFDR